MAIANLLETLHSYELRKNSLQCEIMENQALKACAVSRTAENNSILSAGKAEIRARFKKLWEENPQYSNYTNYDEIPEFEEEMDRLTAQIQAELDEIAAWETQLNNEQTNMSTEMAEIDAYIDSFRQMLQQNITDDFNFGGG